MSTELIKELEQLLGQYYASKQRNDYFDKAGKGKLLLFGKKLDRQQIMEYPDDYCRSIISSALEENDDEFPCFTDRQMGWKQRRKQFAHLFQYLYEHRAVPSDSDLRTSFFANSKTIHELDQLLGEHYASKECTTYFDEFGIGKFRLFCESQGWNDGNWQKEMGPGNRQKYYFDRIFGDDFPEYQPNIPPIHQCRHLLQQLNHQRIVPSDSELIASYLANTKIIHEIDQLLGEYYAAKELNHYSDENGRGIFRFYCEQRGYIDDDHFKDDKWTFLPDKYSPNWVRNDLSGWI